MLGNLWPGTVHVNQGISGQVFSMLVMESNQVFSKLGSLWPGTVHVNQGISGQVFSVLVMESGQLLFMLVGELLACVSDRRSKNSQTFEHLG